MANQILGVTGSRSQKIAKITKKKGLVFNKVL
jgi:hypothetical protein